MLSRDWPRDASRRMTAHRISYSLWHGWNHGKNVGKDPPSLPSKLINIIFVLVFLIMLPTHRRYERNLQKLCSFFAKGECNRGSLCPFRHEAPRDRNDPLSKQNTKDRFFGTNDPVASGMMKHQREKTEKRRAELLARGGVGDERAVSTLYVRFASDESGRILDLGFVASWRRRGERRINNVGSACAGRGCHTQAWCFGVGSAVRGSVPYYPSANPGRLGSAPST